ncbi:stearoyl-CoA 9-desaturase [Micromonospora peucetia]|uniref:stearoyl-CoA 9-desaturase n=1 Tax=Micromonospora peucetia TaxID=47871 RepID=UPI0033187C68
MRNAKVDPADDLTGSKQVDDVADPVRESMRILPDVFALPLTFLTGRPHLGQRPARITATRHLVNAFVSLLTGLAVTAATLHVGGWCLLLLPLGWAVTLHGMRNLRMMIFHQCAHSNMWGRKRLDAAVGRLVAALLMVQQFDRYQLEHVSEHHALHHMTVRDPTVQAILLTLELRPGMTRRQMWRKVLYKLVSPSFHLRFSLARIRSYFDLASASERVMATVGLVVVAALTTQWQAWTFVLIGWVLPLTVFFQMSNTLRLCVKHVFPAPGHTDRRGPEYFGGLTNAIFLGEAAPRPGQPWPAAFYAWTRWSCRMAFVHFPARYLVLTGDTVCHDYHHRHPKSPDWPNYIFAREQDRLAGHRAWPNYQHVWGMLPAVNLVFDSLCRADPDEYNVARLREVSRRELFTAFED